MMLNDTDFKFWLMKSQQGDETAKETLVKENLNLVRSVVSRFQNRGYEWDDLFQIGCIGLVKALERFDLSYETKFSTYAVPLIMGEIRRYIRDDHPIKVSRSVKELAYRIHQTQETMEKQFGREPTIGEVATEMKLEPSEVAAALEAIQPAISLFEQPFSADEHSLCFVEQLANHDLQEKRLLERLTLMDILARLPKPARQVIELRFFADYTQRETGERLGLSQVQVSRLEKNSLQMIRALVRNDKEKL